MRASRPVQVSLPTALLLAAAMAIPAAAEEPAPSAKVQTELLAWSGDGSAALVSEHVTQANGGAQYAVQVISGAKRGKRYVLSDIPKPDARKPQKVSDKSCGKTLARLKKDLDARGFVAVTVAADCSKRDGLVTAGEQAAAGVADSWFSGDDPKRLTRSNWALSLVRNTLTVSVDGKPVASWPDTPQYLKLRASMSKDGKLLVVMHEWLGGNRSIALVAYTKTGAPADLKELRI